MLRRMVSAIGRVLGITQPAGPVHPTQDSPTGGNSNIAAVPKSAKQGSKTVRSRAPRATKAQSQKAETSRAPTRTKKSSEPGTKQATPARQPAKSKSKPKRSVAQPTTAVASRKPVQKAAQAGPGATGKQAQTTARRTRQHAK